MRDTCVPFSPASVETVGGKGVRMEMGSKRQCQRVSGLMEAKTKSMGEKRATNNDLPFTKGLKNYHMLLLLLLLVLFLCFLVF